MDFVKLKVPGKYYINIETSKPEFYKTWYDNITQTFNIFSEDLAPKSEATEECIDQKDCAELGIIDLDSCEFAPWANERCPLTCATCKKESKILILYDF